MNNLGKTSVVITTINGVEGTALSDFASRDNLQLIIAGDTKTPESYGELNCEFISVDRQKELFPTLFETIPFRHYARKNFGYLYAMSKGQSVILESDDDNYPDVSWFTLPVTTSEIDVLADMKFPNVYKLFTDEHIWPRGFPLDRITTKEKYKLEKKKVNVMVWQSLVNGDADVDAIYRLTNGKEIEFAKNKTVVLDKGVVSAFNTQNTAWFKPAYDLMYLPHTVSFRYTDILRSFVAQYGIWARDGRVGFISPNAKQIRNAHNYLKDFSDEVSMYTSFYEVIEALDNCNLSGEPNDLLIMYQALEKIGVVKSEEIKTVELWLDACKKYE